MPRKRKRQNRPEAIHTHLAIRVQRYDAHVSASINRNVYAPQYGWNLDDEDPLYEFTSQVTIAGISTYPDERAGENYEVTIYGNDAPSRRLNLKLKDSQTRDKHGALQYREYRGRQIPVYVAPHGFGLLDAEGRADEAACGGEDGTHTVNHINEL